MAVKQDILDIYAKEVEGIKDGIFDKIKDQIKVS